jgi:hypothetical protein
MEPTPLRAEPEAAAAAVDGPPCEEGEKEDAAVCPFPFEAAVIPGADADAEAGSGADRRSTS